MAARRRVATPRFKSKSRRVMSMVRFRIAAALLACFVVANHSQGGIVINVQEFSDRVTATFNGSVNLSVLNATGTQSNSGGLSNRTLNTNGSSAFNVYTLPGFFSNPFGTKTVPFSSTTNSSTRFGFGRYLTGSGNSVAGLYSPLTSTQTVSVSNFIGTWSDPNFDTLAELGLSRLSQTSYLNGNVTLTISPQLLGREAVPEAGSLAVFSFAVLGVLGMRLHQQRRPRRKLVCSNV